MRRIRFITTRAVILFTISSMMMAIGVGSAAAETERFSIPIDTIVIEKRQAPGFIKELLTQAIGARLLGATCTVTATASNQESVHPNNDLLIGSGGSSVTLFDVERAPGAVTQANGQLTLGGAIILSVRLGADLRFSANMTVDFDCELVPPPPEEPPPVEPPPVVVQQCVSDPQISIAVTPESQDVEPGASADFEILLTNTGDVDLENVGVDSNLDVCDNIVGGMVVGGEAGYECSIPILDVDVDATFAVTGTDVSCGTEIGGSVQSSVQLVEPPTIQGPPVVISTPPLPPPPTPPKITTRIIRQSTATATTTPATPSGVPTGIGESGPAGPPIAALAVVALGIAAVGVGTYRVTRKER